MKVVNEWISIKSFFLIFKKINEILVIFVTLDQRENFVPIVWIECVKYKLQR